MASQEDAKLAKRGIATDGNRWARIKSVLRILDTKSTTQFAVRETMGRRGKG